MRAHNQEGLMLKVQQLVGRAGESNLVASKTGSISALGNSEIVVLVETNIYTVTRATQKS